MVVHEDLCVDLELLTDNHLRTLVAPAKKTFNQFASEMADLSKQLATLGDKISVAQQRHLTA